MIPPAFTYGASRTYARFAISTHWLRTRTLLEKYPFYPHQRALIVKTLLSTTPARRLKFSCEGTTKCA
eukprot:scaffold13271_cov110-Cylindrotheca_fusiformis.AAC.1